MTAFGTTIAHDSIPLGGVSEFEPLVQIMKLQPLAYVGTQEEW